MSKGKKRCYFCGCGLTNQNRTATTPSSNRAKPWRHPWVDCCHACKAKDEKKAPPYPVFHPQYYFIYHSQIGTINRP